MPAEIRLTRAEYFSAQTLHARRNFRRIWWIWLLLFLGIGVWMQYDRIGNPAFYWGFAVYMVAGVLLVAALGLVMPWMLAAIMVLTVWGRQPTLRDPVRFEIGDEGIRYENERGNWQYRWSDMIARAENARVCLLYLAPNLMLMLPRRALSEADLATIRRHLGR